MHPSSPCDFSKSSSSVSLLPRSSSHWWLCHLSLTSCFMPASAQYTPSTLALPPSCTWKKTDFIMDEPTTWKSWWYVIFCFKPGKDALSEVSWEHICSRHFDSFLNYYKLRYVKTIMQNLPLLTHATLYSWFQTATTTPSLSFCSKYLLIFVYKKTTLVSSFQKNSLHFFLPQESEERS